MNDLFQNLGDQLKGTSAGTKFVAALVTIGVIALVSEWGHAFNQRRKPGTWRLSGTTGLRFELVALFPQPCHILFDIVRAEA